jgi:hypothetical protein
MQAACAADAASFCPETEPGPARGRCLRDHASELSETCRQALATRRRGPRAGPGVGGGPRAGGAGRP